MQGGWGGRVECTRWGKTVFRKSGEATGGLRCVGFDWRSRRDGALTRQGIKDVNRMDAIFEVGERRC